jgi:hypothetical protein
MLLAENAATTVPSIEASKPGRLAARKSGRKLNVR